MTKEGILAHYMQSPEGRQKLLASAYEPAWAMFEYLTFGDGPKEDVTPERFTGLLDAVPPAERGEAWTRLRHVVDALLAKV